MERPEEARLPDWAHDIVPLDRPLAVLDLETTGTQVAKDRIIEIGVVKVHPEGRHEERTRRVDPGIPIPPEATAVHGIRNEDLLGAPTFGQIAASLVEFLEGCDLAGFGLLAFDLPLLRNEFERAGVEFLVSGRRLIDAKSIFHQKEPRDLSAAHRFYCGTGFTGAHSATADAEATYRVLLGQLRRYPDLPHSMDGLHRACNPVDGVDIDRRLVWQGGEAMFAFGRHRGELLRAVRIADPEYLEWIMEGDFSADLKRIAAQALQGTFPSRPSHAPPEAVAPRDPAQARLPFPASPPAKPPIPAEKPPPDAEQPSPNAEKPPPADARGGEAKPS